MIISKRWGGAAPTAHAPEVATSLDPAFSEYTEVNGIANRHLIQHFRLSPTIATTIAMLAGLGDGV